MHDEVEHLVSLYDRGGITRRQLLQGLAAVGISGRTAPSQDTGNQPPVFQARSINHVSLYVSDVARSKAFYRSLTGLPVRAEDPTFCEFHLENSFLGLYSPDQAQRVGIDHFCFGIEQYNPPAALARLKAAVPSAQPTLANEDQVFVRDPDGVRVQFADVTYKR